MASKFENLSVSEALERSLRNAKHLRAVHSATVQAARVLARKIDDLMAPLGDDDGPAPPLDNVSVPTFLKYCQALGLVPDLVAEPASGGKAAATVSPLEAWRRDQAKRKSA